ncbi:MAG: DUF1501 domain-containing protein [Paludisphaera borealis]|uniref:DUF1501 domain-containing protein n=1 Tax=Paludisphaera borealis TaxID=1387353 RepID=UPI00284E321C|nr:DUF1501 domain-containing protein [Paludisphaera borealis]MDR3623285.1 DUF1501 domain-containing protein [Paludisphaera borealis]
MNSSSNQCPGPCSAAAPINPLNRREWLKRTGNGFGLLALSSLLQQAEATAAGAAHANPLAPRAGHFPSKAKRCIFLFMTGGPSQMDLFDPKPALARLDGQPLPPSFGKIHSQFLESDPLCLASHRKWGRYGESGMDMSDLVPHLHKHADDICLIRSCVADSVIHAPAMYQMTTGRILMGYPSMGSWVTYGLGSESDNLPSYVVMTQPEGTPEGGAPCWGAGFLPAHHQGTLFRGGPAPIVNLKPPADITLPRQRRLLDLLRSMNEQDLSPGDTELSARISSYELAFRMQSAAPEAVDMASESERTKEMYGLDDHRTVEFGTRCLLARRLVERGVRFVQLYSGGGPVATQWDAHDDIDANHEKMCGMTDKPVAALLTDLKRSGLLDETLVVWGGEFGRTPVRQGGGRGRDHNATGFTMWMAGGGVKGGAIVGATDEIGLNQIADRAHVNDIHATILHLMGLDHLRLTYLHSGRDERLTDVAGSVLKGVLA